MPHPSNQTLVVAGDCQIYKAICAEHGFTHGAEAEELRNGIESVIERCDPEDPAGILNALRELLDQTDARDSLAYLEAKKPPRKRKAKR